MPRPYIFESQTKPLPASSPLLATTPHPSSPEEGTTGSGSSSIIHLDTSNTKRLLSLLAPLYKNKGNYVPQIARLYAVDSVFICRR